MEFETVWIGIIIITVAAVSFFLGRGAGLISREKESEVFESQTEILIELIQEAKKQIVLKNFVVAMESLNLATDLIVEIKEEPS